MRSLRWLHPLPHVHRLTEFWPPALPTISTMAPPIECSPGTILCVLYAAARRIPMGILPTANFLRRHPGTLMATYLELKAQADALAQQAEEARLAELDAIISSIREQIAEYGITPEQLFGRRRAVASSPRAPIAPKYRDPKTGATWSGRGKAPHWIAQAKNRSRFLIEQ